MTISHVQIFIEYKYNLMMRDTILRYSKSRGYNLYHRGGHEMKSKKEKLSNIKVNLAIWFSCCILALIFFQREIQSKFFILVVPFIIFFANILRFIYVKFDYSKR